MSGVLNNPGLVLVMVRAWVGKEFPDTRQNEREIKFIRAGDAARTAGQLRGEPTLKGSSAHFYGRGTRSGAASCGSFADWMRQVCWVRGEQGKYLLPVGQEG